MDPSIAHKDFGPPKEPRKLRVLLLALLVHVPLVLALAWGVNWKREHASEVAQAEPQPAAAEAVPVPAPAPAAQPAPEPATPRVAQQQPACPIVPLLTAAAGGKDGQLFPPADVDGKTASDIATMLVVGKEVAAAGQPRDAEVAFLTSCRIADALKGPASVESANAKYQLARHYAAVANSDAPLPAANRFELLRRAETYYTDSLQSYNAKLGAKNEKTVFAAEGLGAVRQGLQRAAGASAAPAPATGTGPSAPPASPSATVQAPPLVPAAPSAAPPLSAATPVIPEKPQRNARGSARTAARGPVTAPVDPPLRQATGDPEVRSESAPQGTPTPSFNCARARSRSEKMICADAELSRLDRDLGRLYARARRAAPDPAAFRRESDRAWSQREAICRDRDCLVRWYAQRREQLMGSLGERPRGGTASR